MAKFKNLKPYKKYQLIKIIRDFEKAIKLNCYDCMGGQKKADCELKKCSLHQFSPWAKNNKNNKDFQIRKAMK